MMKSIPVALLTILAAAAPARAGDIDLSHWKLTIPVEDQGRRAGKPVDIEPEALRGYSSEWFHRAPDGGLVFMAPVGAVATTHAQYGRSELRERLDPHSDQANWTMDDGGEMTARMKVLQVPDKNGKIVVGQIHGLAQSPLIKLVYANKHKDEKGVLYGITTTQPKPDGDRDDEQSEKCTIASNVALNQEITYHIRVAAGSLSYSADGGETCTVKLDPAWKGQGLYFKAGVYLAAKDGGGAGEVEFYQLAVSH